MNNNEKVKKRFTGSIMQVIGVLDSGGAEHLFVDICNILYQNNYNVIGLFTRRGGPLEPNINSKIKTISLNRKYRWSIFAILKFIHVSKSYNVIHVHSRHNLLWVCLITFLDPFNKYKIIFHDHYGIDNDVPYWFYLIKKKIDKYIGVSTNLRNWAIKELKLKKADCFVLPNIRFLEPMRYLPNRFQKDVIRFVHVANILRNKNIEFSIKLIERFSKYKKVSLSIYGSAADKQYLDELKKNIKDYNLSSHIKFIHNENKIESILPKYDIGLCTSYAESGPLSIIEYLHSGMPFLTINQGEVVKQIQKNHSEYILNSFSLDDWEVAFKNILDNSYDKIGYDLQDTFHKNFSSEKYLKKLNNIYLKTINE